jgi:hypothetical protein
MNREPDSLTPGDSADRGLNLSPSPDFHAAIEVLYRARQYAENTRRDVWDFAVEASVLQRYGLTSADLRWLVCKGFVLHGSELSRPGSSIRSFRQQDGLSFESTTCFVLTDAGLRFASAIAPASRSFCDLQAACQTAPAARAAQNGVSQSPSGNVKVPNCPRWDSDSRELWYLDRLVKQFRVPSPNQEIVIMSFEEEGWPTGIDDPLPHHVDRDPKQRLHDTIRSLNRNQKHRLLKFKGNGTGQGVIWEPLSPDLRDGNPPPSG